MFCFCFDSVPVLVFVLTLADYPTVLTCSVFSPNYLACLYCIVSISHCEFLPVLLSSSKCYFLIIVSGFPICVCIIVSDYEYLLFYVARLCIDLSYEDNSWIFQNKLHAEFKVSHPATNDTLLSR